MFELYGFFILLGIIFSYIFTFHSFFSKYINIYINKEVFFDFFIYIYISAFIGGKLLFIIFDSDFNFDENIFLGGFSVLGSSIFGSMGALIYYFKEKNYKIRKSFFFIPLLILIIHSFGRIGCFFSGCCSGNIYLFKNIPIQIISSIWYLIAFIVAMFLYKKNKINSFFKSIYFYIFFIIFERILFDPFRDDKILVYKIFNKLNIYKYQLLGFFVLIFLLFIYFIIKLIINKQNKK
jgi:phosphatidylglycerol:prolipoprotein diacylglycerol transferase